MTTDVSTLVQNVLLQAGGGIAVGAVVDAIFSEAPSDGLVKLALVTGAQLAVNGVLSVMYFDMLSRRNLISGADATRGISYTTALLASQPVLMSRLQQLGSSLRSSIANFTVDLGAEVGVGAANTTGAMAGSTTGPDPAPTANSNTVDKATLLGLYEV
jgi:hypothetical protein